MTGMRVVVVAASSLVLAACGTASTPAAPTSSSSVPSAPTVSQPIYGGRVIIASGLEKADAQELVDHLTG